MWSTKVDENHLSRAYVMTPDERRQYRERNPIPARPLLPPPTSQNASRILLVLDLDETMMHATYAPPRNYSFSFKLQLPMSRKFADVFVQVRPFLEEFLTLANRWFEVAVYTASLPVYADRILDQLDTRRIIKHRLYRHHCTVHKDHYVKDLEFLGRPLQRIILIDNHPASYMAHRDNALPIISYFGQPGDTGLKDLIPFLEEVRSDTDVTPRVRRYANAWRDRLQQYADMYRQRPR